MSVLIKNLEIGEGRTKICVPVIGEKKESILIQAEQLKESAADIIEWRADYYCDVMDIDKVLSLIEDLTNTLGDKPVLFTFRTKKEGGEKSIDSLYYKMLIKNVVKQGKVGAVDVELFMGDGLLTEISEYCKEYGVKIIASNHDFEKTPDKNEIVNRLTDMKRKGADISKIAVMPQNSKDVLTLLEATEEVKNTYPDMTIITMSMGQLGVISRLSGKTFGSAMTFAARTKELASAPGQIEMAELERIISLIENN